MEQFSEFMDNYFIYIWLVVVATVASVFYIRGKRAIQMFSDLDLSQVLYSEKNASGYSTKSLRTKWGGASKTLHVIITNKELIIKTYMFLAGVAKTHDMLHRIPRENILKTEIKKGALISKLFVQFKGQNDELKEIVIMSNNNMQIKDILNK